MAMQVHESKFELPEHRVREETQGRPAQLQRFRHRRELQILIELQHQFRHECRWRFRSLFSRCFGWR